jgi:hypothetical protein
MRGGIFTALPLACATTLLLLSIGGMPIPFYFFASAMGTLDRDADHETFRLSL